MDLAGVGKAMTAMAIFDMWEAGLEKLNKAHKPVGSPLVAAAAQAFEQYLQTQEIGHAAMISGVAMYALNPTGTSASPVTRQDIAPFLALNILA